MNLAVARHLCAIAEGAVVADLCVMGDMHAFHEEVAVAYACVSLTECGTVDYNVLTEDVLIADDEA